MADSTTTTALELRGKDNIKMKADTIGPENAPHVILLHGGGQTRQSWQNTNTILAANGYRATSIDLRGHGESEWDPAGDYDFETLLADVERCCEQLPGPASLVGASIGGALSLLLAARRPELCRALVLVDVSPTIDISGAQGIVDFMRANPDGFADLEEAQQNIARHSPNRKRASSTSGLLRVLRKRADGRWGWHWDPNFITGEWHQKVHKLSSLMKEAAPQVSQPSLLIRGQLSSIVSMESVEELKRDIPHLEFTDIAGAGHMVAGDRNDMASEALIHFLDNAVPR